MGLVLDVAVVDRFWCENGDNGHDFASLWALASVEDSLRMSDLVAIPGRRKSCDVRMLVRRKGQSRKYKCNTFN